MVIALHLFLLSSSISSTPSAQNIKPIDADTQFHAWCEEVGIINSPSIQLATSPLSVAGRGVFALEEIPKEKALITIPPHCVLTSTIAATYFPDVSKDLQRKRRRRQGWFRRLRRRDDDGDDDCYWQPELTAYALAAVASNHPWAAWINQWNRDDPILRLFEEGVKPSDENRVSAVADELQMMLPNLSQIELQAAVQIRLQRFEEQLKIFFGDNDSYTRAEIARMYTILGSRALDLEDGIVGVVPMYDMINHSLDPNLGFYINDDYNLELFALRDIRKGEELFLCYNEENDIDQNGWTELNALWTLVQWGIPMPDEIANEQLSRKQHRKHNEKK